MDLKTIGKTLLQQSPSILAGLGAVGVVSTTVMGIAITFKAVEEIQKEVYRRVTDWTLKTGEEADLYPIDPVLTTKETIKLVWPLYIPTVGMGIVSIACILGSNSIHQRRTAALVTAYSILGEAAKEYQNKVIEILGEKKEEKLRGEIAQDRLNRDPIENKEIIITGLGETDCYDSISARYFKSDIETIRKIQNDFNQALISESYRSLNQFYDALGLEHTSMGDELGWSTDFGLMDIKFGAKLSTQGKPCIVLDYRIGPRNI